MNNEGQYLKEIEVTSTGMIVAKVRGKVGGSVKGVNFFSSIFNSNKNIEKNCKKAHLWADELILVCIRQET